MPNWCANHLTITGPRDALEAFAVNAAVGMSPERAARAAELLDDRDEVRAVIAENIASGHVALSFERDVPEPPGVDWYRWRIEHWGTKWDARSPEMRWVEVDGAPALRYTFDTAWSPPAAWLAATAKRHRQLRFVLLWIEEQGLAGRFEASGDELHAEDIHDAAELRDVHGWLGAPFVPSDDEDEADLVMGDAAADDADGASSACEPPTAAHGSSLAP